LEVGDQEQEAGVNMEEDPQARVFSKDPKDNLLFLKGEFIHLRDYL